MRSRNDNWTRREEDLLRRLELATKREGAAKAHLQMERAEKRDLQARLHRADDALRG